MKKLDDLVPPLDLCKRIPAGEFADTYAAYFFDSNGANITLDKREGDAIWKDVVIAPAPTLAEILEKLPSNYKLRMKYSRDDKLVYSVYSGEVIERDMNAASAALKVWLKLEGIKA